MGPLRDRGARISSVTRGGINGQAMTLLIPADLRMKKIRSLGRIAGEKIGHFETVRGEKTEA